MSEKIVKKRDSNRARVNEQIRDPEVRLVGADGKQIGIVSSREARAIAAEAGLDLVEINPTSEPPVCRVMDYGKFLFELKKKTNAAKKKQKQVQLKEVKFRLTTEEGDYQVKLRNLIRFLEQGDKAKISIRFRGREVTHPELGRGIMDRLKADLAEYGTIEQQSKFEGRQMIMVLAPKKN